MRALIATFAGLVVLTLGSWALSGVALGAAEMPVAISIAVIKAGLVVVFFMHLMEEEASTVLALLSGVFFVLLLAGFVVVDVATR